MPIIRTRGLRKVFRSVKRMPGAAGALRTLFSRSYEEKIAVRDVDIDIEAGELVGYIGPNGAGKSTTIKMLTGILVPTSGTIEVAGIVPYRDRKRNARNIGVVFGQRSQLYWDLPLIESFELLRAIYTIPRDRYNANLATFTRILEMEPFLRTPVPQLSLGQRMRAEVAASLLHAPKVLFLDEPTIGLDVIARQELRDLLLEWNRDEGLTVFLTSHDAGDVERVARRVIVINNGRVVLDDKVSALRRQYLGSKVLSVKFHDPPTPFSLPGVSTLKASEYALKLEVDTRVTPIEQVMSAVLRAGPVADIAIEDPPLEAVIAHIYGQAAQPQSLPAVEQ